MMQTPQDRAGLVLKPGKTVNLAHSEQRKQKRGQRDLGEGQGRAMGPAGPGEVL